MLLYRQDNNNNIISFVKKVGKYTIVAFCYTVITNNKCLGSILHLWVGQMYGLNLNSILNNAYMLYKTLLEKCYMFFEKTILS